MTKKTTSDKSIISSIQFNSISYFRIWVNVISNFNQCTANLIANSKVYASFLY